MNQHHFSKIKIRHTFRFIDLMCEIISFMNRMMKLNLKKSHRLRIGSLACLLVLSWTPIYAAQEKTDEAKIKERKQRIITAKGTVLDETGEPLIGVNVLIRESGTGQVTDLEGKFVLPDIPFGTPLRISFIGYKTQEVHARENMRLVLYEDNTKLDEVVVVGYGAQKKGNLSGAVSSVNIHTLADRPVTNAVNAMAGLASGLTVTNTGGNVPGFESSSIRIRGVGTLNNAEPLVVIDGVAGCSISDINPQDIKNISILKDAASSAIYGSRAANGVILITTKSGYRGSAKITYSNNFSFEKVAKRMNLVTDYADFMEIQNAGLTANGQAPRFSQTSIDAWRNDNGAHPTVYPNTDWQDHIYRDYSMVQTHNLSATGGTKTTRYNLSFGYVNNPGIVFNTDYRRYQMRSNIEADVKPWITIGMNIFGYIDTNNPNAGNATNGGDVIFGSGAFNTVPGMTLYDPETELYGGVQNPEEENVSNFNPYRRQWFYKEEFPIRTRRIVPKAFASIRPVKGLTVSGSFTYNYWDKQEEYHLCDKNLYRFTLDGPVLLREGTVRTYINRYNTRNTYRASEVTALYEGKASRLDFSVLLGASQEYNKEEQEHFRKYDLIDDALTGIDAGTTNGEIQGNYTEWAMRSYFGRINLAWDDRYLLEMNLRADGSSKFAPDKRWGLFPSVSAGWNIAEEAFMENTRGHLDVLKLRASYGMLGNNATSSYYMYQPLFSPANYVLGNTVVSGLAQTALPNADLTWETTRMADIGLDYALFSQRLNGSLDLYDRLTKDILIALPAPLEHGTSSVPMRNAGEVRNRGVDFDINWLDHFGSVSYSVGFRMGYVKNKVLKFQGSTPAINGVLKLQEGKPINQLYVMHVDRIVRDQKDLDYVQSLVEKNPNYFATYQRPELGDFLYADSNRDGNLDMNDRIEIGNGNSPVFTYGANLSISWRGFDFSLLLQGVGKHQVYYNNQAFRFVTVMGQSLNKDITDKVWTPENPYDSRYPRLRNNADGRNNIASDALVFNAAYLRCKNIQLGYTLPPHISNKFFVSNLKLYASIDNLFTLTSFPGLDPEIPAGVGYPQLRQYSVGINVTF